MKQKHGIELVIYIDFKLTMLCHSIFFCRIYKLYHWFGAVDEPLASCMIVYFSAHISKWELVCKFGVIFHILIISCLCSRFHVRNQWFFYSVITFSYIKCFVHSYTIDVVFTLSYWFIWIQQISVTMIICRYVAVLNLPIYKHYSNNPHQCKIFEAILFDNNNMIQARNSISILRCLSEVAKRFQTR